jgi:hypothetical protein
MKIVQLDYRQDLIIDEITRNPVDHSDLKVLKLQLKRKDSVWGGNGFSHEIKN